MYYSKDVTSHTHQTVLLVLIIVFTHSVITSTFLTIIDQISHCVNITWKYQSSDFKFLFKYFWADLNIMYHGMALTIYDKGHTTQP